VDFSTRSYQQELLDRDDIPDEDIRRNMQELNIINTWLGGHAITLRGIRAFVHNKSNLVICEIGCGGGDNLAAIARWCRRCGIAAHFIGIDHNPYCIAVAKERLHNVNARFFTADYRQVHFDEPPDIIFSSLFCHHFTETALVSQLQWMQQQARLGFFINDLHRHPVAYYAIRWLTAAFSRSYLVKHDAPLSVLRGFTRKEWQMLLHKAGIGTFSVRWQWAFRWLVTAER
jgi:SAM-dependent methyltransferase